MFDIGIGFSELMLLAVIVIIVVGPEELPSLLRTVGRYVGQVRRIAGDFRAQVDEAIKEPMGEIQSGIEGVTENLDDDPFGEEDFLDFEEHNQKVLDKEKEDLQNETATEKALRESGVEGLNSASETSLEADGGDADVEVQEGGAVLSDDAVLAQKSGT